VCSCYHGELNSSAVESKTVAALVFRLRAHFGQFLSAIHVLWKTALQFGHCMK
jgi:hypothetical protein